MKRTIRSPSSLLIIALLMLAHVLPANAEIFCVDSAPNLRVALISSANNGEHNEIHIMQGIYVGKFVYDSSYPNDLSLLGGYDAGCSSRLLDPTNTILEGIDTSPVLSLSSSTTLKVEGLTLHNPYGGGISVLLKWANGANGALTIEHNNIHNTNGIGVYILCGGPIDFHDVKVAHNSIKGNAGRGVESRMCYSFDLSNNSIHHNLGGGILGDFGKVSNNSIYSNSTTDRGGGILSNGTVLTNNRIESNSANKGGGVYFSNGGFMSSNVIRGNSANEEGGGLFIEKHGTVINNTITDNSALTGGGAFFQYYYGGSSSYNNLFWLNTALSNEGADLYVKGGNSGAEPFILSGNNIDQRQPEGIKSEVSLTIEPGNLNALDPHFVDQDNGNLGLQSDSPMIDAGDPEPPYLLNLPNLPDFDFTDFTGGPRYIGSSLDIGADEFDDGTDPKTILWVNVGNYFEAGVIDGVKVISNPVGIDCGSDCTGAYFKDTQVILSAIINNPNMIFEGWSYNCGGGLALMSRNQRCTAWFSAVRQLTVLRDGSGSGTVTSEPTGINCGDSCSAPFYMESYVTLTATADFGSLFTGWVGDGCPHVYMDKNRSCTAFFDKTSSNLPLLINKSGSGSGLVTSDPVGINCGNDCLHGFPPDTKVILTAIPQAADSVFNGWSGDADCEDGQVTMSTKISCTANFNAVRQLTVAKEGLGGGIVTSNPAGIDCGFTCQAPFNLGEMVQLNATPNDVSTFAGWSGDASCPNPKLDVNRSCTATFNHKVFRLYTFVAGTGGGTLTSAPAGINCGTDCEEDYVANTLITLTATPDARSSFAGWAGPCTGTAPICQVTMSEVRGVAAIFNLKTYTLSVAKLGDGVVTSNPVGISCGTYCRDTFEDGTPVSLTALPALGSGFVKWSGACTGTGRVCTVTMNAAKNVTATFVPLKITINDVTQSEGNSGTRTFNFTVGLNASTHRTVKVSFATRNGTAQAGTDYNARTGSVAFTADQIAKPLGIAVRGDIVKESNETFFVNLATPVGAIFAKQQGKGIIANDD